MASNATIPPVQAIPSDPVISDAVVEAACDKLYESNVWILRDDAREFEEKVRAAISAAIAADREERSDAIGWLYHNEDTGEEFSRSHPIDSGEVPDATCIRPATAEAFRELLTDAWSQLEDARSDISPDRESSRAEIERLKAECAKAHRLVADAAATVAKAHKWQAYGERLEQSADAALADEIQYQRKRVVEMSDVVSRLTQERDEAQEKLDEASELLKERDDRLALCDRIADLIGLPHDQELDQVAFEIWLSSLTAERDAALSAVSDAEAVLAKTIASIPVAMTAAEEKEREACAKVCEGDFDSEMRSYGRHFAASIRNRGGAK